MNEGAGRLSEAKSLPQGWQWVKLGEVCGEAKTRDPRLFPEASFRYIDISSINAARKQIIGTRATLGKDAPSRARQVVKVNDVLVATTRPNLNAVALVPAELNDGICSTGFCVLRPDNKIEPLLLFYFVQTNDFVRLISGEVRGMLYPAVTDSQVRAIDIPLAPLSEQKRIAAKVQDLMKEVEHARLACEARLEAARALPKAYLRQVFESEEAKQWERRTLGEVVLSLKNGIVAEQDFEGRGFQVTRIETISNGVIDSEKVGYIKLPSENLKNFKLEQGDILFSHINSVERLGNCAIYEGTPPELFHGMNLLCIRADTSVLGPHFLLFWLRGEECKTYYTVCARRAIGQASLNQTDLGYIPIPIPSLTTQQRIATKLIDQMASAEKLKADIEKQLEAIKALPQAILRKAFRGEL
jgi:type I restriction enzyme S subunit